MRAPPAAMLATLLLAFGLPVAANHTQALPDGRGVAFQDGGGNEWWVQVRLGGSAGPTASGVQAMDTNGPWVALAPQTWTSDHTWWAGSFHIEPGHQVRFRANFGADAVESCWFTHPGAAEQCGGTPPPPPPGFTATFSGVKGNEWWVQASVGASEPLAGVDARAGCVAAWTPLAKQSWGGWAASFHIPSGSKVDLRARSASGAQA
ncbi:MAG: hypothetical protein LC623_07525, partial [Halobacteriales archaeon]|nr:hypothetical protein [Halobacteriales archaeon]